MSQIRQPDPLEILQAWSPSEMVSADAPIQVIDMFCGCGGMSLGFAAVGQQERVFRLIGGADVDVRSLATYQKNLGAPAFRQDIVELADGRVSLDDFKRELEGFDPSAPTVLIGCAPCQGFTAHRKRKWDIPDARNSLVGAFAVISARLQPDWIVMENVPELVSGRHWKHFEAFRDPLMEAGYEVQATMQNAASFGAPQERFRVLVVASRSEFAMPNPIRGPVDYRTVRDAIGDLNRVEAGERDPNDWMHKSAQHRQSTIAVIRAVPKDGGSRPSGVGPPSLDKVAGFYDVYGRLPWDRPSITITHYARNPASGRFVHPEQDRGLTMREAARLQGFPDHYEFTGSFDDVFRQIGEAVPPPLSVAVAQAVVDDYKGESVPFQGPLIEEPVPDSFAGVIAGIKASRREHHRN